MAKSGFPQFPDVAPAVYHSYDFEAAFYIPEIHHSILPLTMHPFASFVLRSYYKATGWNEDNLYANLTRSSCGSSSTLFNRLLACSRILQQSWTLRYLMDCISLCLNPRIPCSKLHIPWLLCPPYMAPLGTFSRPVTWTSSPQEMFDSKTWLNISRFMTSHENQMLWKLWKRSG